MHICVLHLKIVFFSVGNMIFVGYTYLFVSKTWNICDIICWWTQGCNGSGYWTLGEVPSLSNSWPCTREIKHALWPIESLNSHHTEWQTEPGNYLTTSRFMLHPMLPIMCCHCVTVWEEMWLNHTVSFTCQMRELSSWWDCVLQIRLSLYQLACFEHKPLRATTYHQHSDNYFKYWHDSYFQRHMGLFSFLWTLTQNIFGPSGTKNCAIQGCPVYYQTWTSLPKIWKPSQMWFSDSPSTSHPNQSHTLTFKWTSKYSGAFEQGYT